METAILPQIGSSGLIIYDGSCGACSAFIGERKAIFERYGFTVAPLQESWVTDLTGLDQETLMQSIHLLLPDEDILRGADVFDYLSGKVWWLAPVHIVLKIPALKRLFIRLYSYVARRRRKISEVCRLQTRAKYRR